MWCCRSASRGRMRRAERLPWTNRRLVHPRRRKLPLDLLCLAGKAPRAPRRSGLRARFRRHHTESRPKARMSMLVLRTKQTRTVGSSPTSRCLSYCLARFLRTAPRGPPACPRADPGPLSGPSLRRRLRLTRHHLQYCCPSAEKQRLS